MINIYVCIMYGLVCFYPRRRDKIFEQIDTTSWIIIMDPTPESSFNCARTALHYFCYCSHMYYQTGYHPKGIILVVKKSRQNFMFSIYCKALFLSNLLGIEYSEFSTVFKLGLHSTMGIHFQLVSCYFETQNFYIDYEIFLRLTLPFSTAMARGFTFRRHLYLCSPSHLLSRSCCYQFFEPFVQFIFI